MNGTNQKIRKLLKYVKLAFPHSIIFHTRRIKNKNLLTRFLHVFFIDFEQHPRNRVPFQVPVHFPFQQ